jgi:dihydrofolate synthase/folylpolyglutamate synthase
MRKRRLREVPTCQLVGSYQDKNQQTAFVALQVLRNYCQITLSQEAIVQGFAQVCTLTGLRGRWEVLANTPLTICDTGHNGHGIRYVADQLRSVLSSTLEGGARGELHIILGMVADKDIDVVLSILPENAIYYFTQPNTTRAFPAEDLQQRFLALRPDTECTAYTCPMEALQAAYAAAQADDVVFIGGSNYLVGEVLRMPLPAFHN